MPDATHARNSDAAPAPTPPRIGAFPGRIPAVVTDVGFLAVLVALSVASYVDRLGFYSDDWSFLANLTFSEDRSLLGLTRAMTGPHMHMRPVQGLYQSWLYQLFGMEPLGYHMVNGAVLACTAVFLFLALRELGQSRLIALAVAAVYALLPHYSADRFWFAAFQATLSMALYALCLFATLRAVRTPGARWWSWSILGGIALIGSVLAYEVAIPLFLLNPALAWYCGRRLYGSDAGQRPFRARGWVVTASTLAAFVPAIAFKVATTTRVGNVDVSLPQHVLWIVGRALRWDFDRNDYGLNVWRAVEVHFGELGLALPYVVWRIVRDRPSPAVLAMAGAVGVLVFVYLRLAARAEPAWSPDQKTAWRTIAAGVVVFWLGFAIFLTNPNIHLTATGIGNRTAIAAALGVALLFVGLAALIAAIPRSTAVRRHLFAALVALLCAMGTLINGSLASYWTTAWHVQLRVLESIRTDLPTLPSGTQVMLDGVCPYAGPAVVFEAPWDLASALELVYRDRTVGGDVVTPRMTVEDGGLRTTIYDQEHRYRYDDLVIYDARSGTSYVIADADEARAFLDDRRVDPGRACPPGEPGIGVRVF